MNLNTYQVSVNLPTPPPNADPLCYPMTIGRTKITVPIGSQLMEDQSIYTGRPLARNANLPAP